MKPIENQLCRYFLSAIGGVVGGIANGLSTYFTNKQNLKAQQKENALNRQHAEDMYNKYESPVAQAQQMREAGLNPNGSVAPNSVGTASTSSLPPAQAPDFGSAIQSAFAIPEAKLSLENLKLQNDSIRQKNETDRLTNMKLAVEANDWESYWTEYKRGVKNANDKTEAEAQKAFEEAKMLQEFTSEGGNTYTDAHNESAARIDKLRQDISSSLNSMINDNISLDMAMEKHDLEKSIMGLEIQERYQLILELLDTWEVRKGLLNSDVSVKKLLLDEMTRADKLGQKKHVYDFHIAKQVAEKIENNEPVDAVLLKHLTDDPTSVYAITLKLGQVLLNGGKAIVQSQNDKKLPSGAFRH